MIRDLIKLIRVKHYVKNLFIFLPAFFGFKLLDINVLRSNFIAFLSFSLIASAVYVLNDIVDYKADKNHYKNKLRPIASGAISIKNAVLIFFMLIILGFFLSLFVNSIYVTVLILIYLLVNLSYSFGLKTFPIVDVFLISFGYVLRILIGGASGDVFVNYWIIIMTFLLALFLGFAKRRDDVLIMVKDKKLMRDSVNGYNLQFIDSILFITAAVTIVSYIMYTVSSHAKSLYQSNYIYVTSIFVLLGIFRYLQITIVLQDSSSPTEALYKDRVLQFSILAWILLFTIIVYF